MREIRIKGWPLFGYRPCLERFVHIERDLDLKRSAKTIECQAADIASVFRLVMLFERVDRLARIATCPGRGAREGSIRITISLCLIAEQVRHLLLLCGTLPIGVSFLLLSLPVTVRQKHFDRWPYWLCNCQGSVTLSFWQRSRTERNGIPSERS